MLSKLIKYDFLSLNKSLLIMYLLTFASVIVVLVSGNFDTDIAIATKAISKDFALICLLLTLIIPFFNCFFKIKNSLYKNEGYLSNTLPVKSGVLFDAKVFASIFTLIISWIIFVCCFMSSFSGMNIIKLFINVVNNSNMLSTSLEMISLVFSQLLFIFMCFVFGLVIGYRFYERQDFITFIVGISIYLVSHIIVYMLIELFNFNFYSFMTISFGILNILIYFISRMIFKKGINLE